MASSSLPVGEVSNNLSSGIFRDLVFYFKYASSAYTLKCPRPNGKTLVHQLGCEYTEAHGYIARDDDRKEIVIALRGSASIEDLMADSKIALVPFVSPGVSPPSGTLVHAGFLSAWNSVVDVVISIVEAELAAKPEYSIVAVGHSLGGAVASLAAISLRQNFRTSVTRMYSYGQPRTGNRVYAEFFNSEIGANAFRAVHTNDGVPTMIPTLLGYHHHGVEYWQFIDPPLPVTTKQCGAHGEDLLCSASIPSGGINVAHLIYFGIPAITPFCHDAGHSVP